jgi:chemotaxis signal transduction protein
MKQSRYMLFTIDKCRFAIQVSKIHDIIERSELLVSKTQDNSTIDAFKYRGIEVPLIDMAEFYKVNSDLKKKSNMVLLIELNINTRSLLAGLIIDEILEISSFDFMCSNPVASLIDPKTYRIRENMLVNKGQPYMLVDTNELSKICYTKSLKMQTLQALAN